MYIVQFVFESVAAAAAGYGLRVFAFPQVDYEVYFDKVHINKDDVHRKAIDLAIAYLFGWLIIKTALFVLRTILAIFCFIFGPILRLFRLQRRADAIEAKRQARSTTFGCCCFLCDLVAGGASVVGAYVGYLHRYTYEIQLGDKKISEASENFKVVQLALAIAMGLYCAMFIRAFKSLLCCGGGEDVTVEVKVEKKPKEEAKKKQ